MNQTIKATNLIVCGLLLGSACSSSGGEVTISTEPVETTAPATTSTTEPTTTTETTLSEAQIRAEAIVQAEADIEAVVINWYTYPFDSSQGQAALGLEFTTGRMTDQVVAVAGARTAAGEIQTTGPTQAVEVLSVQPNLTDGTASAGVCLLGGSVVLDAETGETLAADGGQAFLGEVTVELVGDDWLVEGLTSDAITGEGQCELSS